MQQDTKVYLLKLLHPRMTKPATLAALHADTGTGLTKVWQQTWLCPHIIPSAPNTLLINACSFALIIDTFRESSHIVT